MKTPSIPLLIILTALMLLSGKATAQVLLHEEFIGTDGTLPENWSASNPATTYLVDNELRYSGLSYVTYTGPDSIFAPEYEITWNMKISQNLITTPDQANNLYFGYDAERDPVDGPIAYSVGIRAFQFNAPVHLVISAQREARWNSPYLAQIRIDELVTLDANNIYTIKVKYDGESIHAALYDDSTLIAEVFHSTGIVPISGQIGFYSITPEKTHSITVTTIPEPSSLALATLVGMVLLARFARTNSSR